MGLGSLFGSFSSRVNVSGLQLSSTAPSVKLKVFWAVLFIVSVVMCVLHTKFIMDTYFRYAKQTTVTVSTHPLESSVSTHPLILSYINLFYLQVFIVVFNGVARGGGRLGHTAPATFLWRNRFGVLGGAPGYILDAKPPRGLGRSPK